MIDLRVTVRHDSAPQETAWSFVHKDSFSLLYLQPFESVPAPYVDVSHVFHDLPAGTYQFHIADSKKDGICCSFGTGSISITNQNNNVLWQHNGKFEEYLGVTLTIGKDGHLEDAVESLTWTSPGSNLTDHNSEAYVNDPENNDEEWPGEFPTDNDSLTVNIKHDSHPQDTKWTVHYLKNTNAPAAIESVKDGDGLLDKFRFAHMPGHDEEDNENDYNGLKDGGGMNEILELLPFVQMEGHDENDGTETQTTDGDSTGTNEMDNQWTKVYSSDSLDQLSNTLQSKTLEHLKPGLYQITVHDSAGNGLCCKFRFGWITITASNGGDSGHDVIWEHNGEFKYQVQVTIKMTEEGKFEVLHSN